jgi:hypothetical protein
MGGNRNKRGGRELSKVAFIKGKVLKTIYLE